jgi:hypothetical protein
MPGIFTLPWEIESKAEAAVGGISGGAQCYTGCSSIHRRRRRRRRRLGQSSSWIIFLGENRVIGLYQVDYIAPEKKTRIKKC